MPELPSRRTTWRWAVWLLFFVLWTYLLCSSVPRQAEEAAEHIHFSRREWLAKFVHLAGYGLFAALGGWLRVPWRFRAPLLFVVMAHATVTELIQEHVPRRSGKLTDVGFDNLGVLLGMALSWKWWTAEPVSPGPVNEAATTAPESSPQKRGADRDDQR
jgi:VanZ family protein